MKSKPAASSQQPAARKKLMAFLLQAPCLFKSGAIGYKQQSPLEGYRLQAQRGFTPSVKFALGGRYIS